MLSFIRNCLLFFLTAGLCMDSVAQEPYQAEADSVVYSEYEDYQEDTLQTYTRHRSGYYKGENVWDSLIHYKGKNTWEDSMVSKTLFLNGKKWKTLSRAVRYHERVEYPRYPDYFYSSGMGSHVTAAREPTIYIETTNSTSEKVYLDSMIITNYINVYETDTTYNYDTLVYCFNNRFFKYHAEWWHGNRVSLRKREYIFDEKGKLKAHKNYTFSGSSPYESSVELLLHEGDTLNLVDTRTEYRDTLKIKHILTSSFDENYRQTGHLWLINGKESSKSETSYYQNGKVREVKQWWEGKLQITTQYWWKEQKGRQEVWTFQENSRTPAHSGNYYGRTDTLIVKGKKTIISYAYRLKSPAAECISVKRKKLNLSYRMEFDERGRTTQLINYSGGKKKPGYIARTWYSK